MQCASCGEQVAATKFCSNCGNNLALSEESLHRTDLSIEWIKGVLTKMGFRTGEPDLSQKNPSILGKHDTFYNCVLEYRKTLPAIIYTAFFNVKPTGLFNKSELLKAVNDASTSTIGVQMSADASDNSLSAQLLFFIPQETRESDLIEFVECANKLVRNALGCDSMKKFYT